MHIYNFHSYSCLRQCSSTFYLHKLSPLLKFHINGLIQCVLFYVWLLLLSKILFRFIHIVEYISSLFFSLSLSSIPFVWLYHTLYAFTVEHFSYIQLRAIMNKMLWSSCPCIFYMNSSLPGVCLIFLMIRYQIAAFTGYHILSICPTWGMLILITL